MSAESVKAATGEAHGGGTSPQPEQPGEQPSAAQRAKERWFNRPDVPDNSVPQQFDTVTLKRADILHGASIEKSSEVVISEETVGKYSKFLDSYVTNLGKLAEIPDPATGQSMYETIMNDTSTPPKFQYDKLVMQLLSKQTTGEDGTTITRGANEAKIKEFLQTSDGFALTTQLMEQYALMTDLGLGMHAVIDDDYYKRQDRKALTRTHETTLHTYPTLRHGKNVAFAKAWSSLKVAGYFVGGRGETTLKYTNDTDLLQEVQNASPTEKAYLKAVVGIDVDKISFTMTSVRNKLKPSYADGYKPDVNTLLQRNTETMQAREDFLVEIGLDPRQIRLPEEFILDDKTETEGLTLRYYQEIMDVYGSLPRGATQYDQLQNMAEARRRVMVRYCERQIALEKAGEGKKVISSLEEKRDAMKSNPEGFRAERRKEIEKTKEEAEKQKGEAQKRKDAISTGPESLAAKSQALVTIETQLYQEYSFSPAEDLDAAIAAKLTLLETSVNLAEASVNLTLQNILTEKERIMNETRKNAADHHKSVMEEVVRAAGKGNLSVPMEDLTETNKIIDAAVEKRFVIELARKQKALEAHEAEKTKLKQLQEQRNAAVRAKEQVNRNLAADSSGHVQKSIAAFDNFTLPGPLGLGLNPDDVRSRSVDDLVGLLTTGTPEEKLALAIFAKAEADAQTEEKAHPVPRYQDTARADITARTGAGITDDELVSSNYAELYNRLIADGMTPADIQAKLPAAMQAAQRRFSNRYNAFAEQGIEYYDGVIEAQNDELEKLTDFKEPIAQIELTVDILKNQIDIYDRSNALEPGTPAYNALFDTTPVDSSDLTYSAAERTKTNLPKWYVATFHHLYPQAKAASNRDELFDTFYRTVPPTELSRVLSSLGSTTSTQRAMSQAVKYLRDTARAA